MGRTPTDYSNLQQAIRNTRCRLKALSTRQKTLKRRLRRFSGVTLAIFTVALWILGRPDVLGCWGFLLFSIAVLVLAYMTYGMIQEMAKDEDA